MDTQHFPYLTCPLCQTHFTRTGMMLLCAEGHTFDIAREGYVYFLQKKLPGDTREMLLARRAFLAQDHYLPIAAMINEIVATALDGSAQVARREPVAILDAGCGEGYYLQQLQTSLHARQVQTNGIGIDISKEAVRLAARSSQNIFGVVASLKERLPFTDNAFQVILNVFAPRNPAEFARVLAPDGLLLIVIPAPAHLQELRAALHLLAIEENKQEHIIAQCTTQARLRLENITPLSYHLHLHQEEIAQLVTMSPNYWHLTDETRRAMQELREIETEIACLGLGFRSSDQ